MSLGPGGAAPFTARDDNTARLLVREKQRDAQRAAQSAERTRRAMRALMRWLGRLFRRR